jgi:hypothetical protein
MNTRLYLGAVGICGMLALTAVAEDAPAAAVPPLPTTAPKPSAAVPPPVAVPAPAAAPAPVTTAETLQKLGVPAPRYPAHPPAKKAGARGKDSAVTAARIVMPTPPPPPRAESKPAPPPGNYVWVPGHHVPIKDEWRWVAGEWGVPATPASVWIEAQYDPKTQSWSPGYWQPDRPDSYETPPPTTKASDGSN